MTAPNLDPQNQAHFAQLQDAWWEVEGPLKTLHHITPCRLHHMQKHVNLQGKYVLDIGCGGGIMAEAMARQGAQVVGIDACETALNSAKSHASISGVSIEYHLSTAEAWSGQSYDIVTCFELLEHVPDPQSVLMQISRFLKPEGWFFLSTLNQTWSAYWQAILMAEYCLRLLPLHTHDYAKFLPPAKIAAWLRGLNLQLQDLTGMGYNPLTKRAFLQEDVSVNYLMAGQLILE